MIPGRPDTYPEMALVFCPQSPVTGQPGHEIDDEADDYPREVTGSFGLSSFGLVFFSGPFGLI